MWNPDFKKKYLKEEGKRKGTSRKVTEDRVNNNQSNYVHV
jgi:hypothetical protein